MAQGKLQEYFLENPDDWFNSYQLHEKLDIRKRRTVVDSLRKLRKHGIIYRKIKLEELAHSDSNIRFHVRYFRLVPDGKFITYADDKNDDKLNEKGHTDFKY